MVVALIATGGTIASHETADGAVAGVEGAELLAAARHLLPHGVEVQVRDVGTKGSYALTLEDMRGVVAECLSTAESAVSGVVVTHGTDSMEETAFLADLLHAGEAPIVFTGAQRTFDATDPDGPANLAFALESAADPRNRGQGVFIAFDGLLLPARGARKVHTWQLHAFDNPAAGRSQGARSTVAGGSPTTSLPDVAVVLGSPGSDGRTVRDALTHGPAGLVYQGMGIGNASPGDAPALADAVRAGVPVLVTSRVQHGPVRPVYGNGGGRTLHDAGAIMAGDLTTAQARILLSVCLATGDGRTLAEDWIATHCDTCPRHRAGERHDEGHQGRHRHRRGRRRRLARFLRR